LGIFLFYLAHREISVSQALIALFQGGKPRG
jgi:hypothetical protein